MPKKPIDEDRARRKAELEKKKAARRDAKAKEPVVSERVNSNGRTSTAIQGDSSGAILPTPRGY